LEGLGGWYPSSLEGFIGGVVWQKVKYHHLLDIKEGHQPLLE